MLRLGIDTSTAVCAGLADDWTVLASERIGDSRSHVEQLMPLVKKLLAEAGATFSDIGEIAVGLGPGPFTGLRVGVAAAATVGEVLGIDVLGVCSLDIVAAQVAGPLDLIRPDANPPSIPVAAGDFLIASDARRQELYWATYSATGGRILGPQVSAPSELPALPTYGPGAERFILRGATREIGLDAGVLALRVKSLQVQPSLEPLYLRRPDADVPHQPKSVLPPVRIGRMKE
jgi:tRNA threonylcarbamoyl adenosine modification protein YeaZ